MKKSRLNLAFAFRVSLAIDMRRELPVKGVCLNSSLYSCFICNKSDLLIEKKINQKPKGETGFGIGSENYLRFIDFSEITKVQTTFCRNELETPFLDQT